MFHVAIHRADGGVSIMTLDDDSHFETELEKWVSQVDKEWLPVASVARVEPSDLPVDENGEKILRDSWRHSDSKIAIDMGHARVVVGRYLDAAAKVGRRSQTDKVLANMSAKELHEELKQQKTSLAGGFINLK